MVTHVDDFLCAGPETELRWFKGALAAQFEISGHMMGEMDIDTNEEIKQLKFLGRRITSTQNGFEWEADPKHVRTLLEELGVGGLQSSITSYVPRRARCEGT